MAKEDRRFLRELWRLMALHLRLDEIRALADELGVPWEELSGKGKSTKSLSLIMYVAEQERIAELRHLLRERNPGVEWGEDPETGDHAGQVPTPANTVTGEEAFRQYLDEVSELLRDKNLFASQPEDEVRDTFQAQTLEVLTRLDGETKGELVRFLHDTRMIGESAMVDAKGASLEQAELRRADLRGVALGGANLSQADLRGADLRGADLRGANLGGADLWGADLSHADLQGAHLWGANLNKAILRQADLSGAHLSDASLWGAELVEADLQGAYLWGVDLREANLQGAKNCSEQQLAMAKSTVGTTLPDGRKNL
jgi:uncharacterized protein YjbI with pentapeptide repeats